MPIRIEVTLREHGTGTLKDSTWTLKEAIAKVRALRAEHPDMKVKLFDDDGAPVETDTPPTPGEHSGERKRPPNGRLKSGRKRGGTRHV